MRQGSIPHVAMEGVPNERTRVARVELRHLALALVAGFARDKWPRNNCNHNPSNPKHGRNRRRSNQPPAESGRALENSMSRLFKLFAAHAISVSAAVFCFVPLAGEIFAAPILAAATRTSAFASTSTASVPVPIRDDGTTSLKFATAAPNESVVVIYNAECALAAARGTRISIKIVVDGNEAEPSSGTDFTFCSALDSSGNTWASPVRQSVLKVPLSGTHTVRVVARLVGGSGEWRREDSSLGGQPALGTSATRAGP